MGCAQYFVLFSLISFVSSNRRQFIPRPFIQKSFPRGKVVPTVNKVRTFFYSFTFTNIISLICARLLYIKFAPIIEEGGRTYLYIYVLHDFISLAIDCFYGL